MQNGSIRFSTSPTKYTRERTSASSDCSLWTHFRWCKHKRQLMASGQRATHTSQAKCWGHSRLNSSDVWRWASLELDQALECAYWINFKPFPTKYAIIFSIFNGTMHHEYISRRWAGVHVHCRQRHRRLSNATNPTLFSRFLSLSLSRVVCCFSLSLGVCLWKRLSLKILSIFTFITVFGRNGTEWNETSVAFYSMCSMCSIFHRFLSA